MVSKSPPLHVFNAASQTIILYFGGKRCKKLIAAYEAIYFQSLIADVLYCALFLFVPVIKHSWVVACDAHKTKHLDFFQKPDDFLVIKQRSFQEDRGLCVPAGCCCLFVLNVLSLLLVTEVNTVLYLGMSMKVPS